METIHTEKFDEQLKAVIPHLNNYQQLLPHIGKNWDTTPYKYLIIAESHYIDNGAISVEHEKNWYNYSTKDFKWKDYIASIDTRLNVRQADNALSFGKKRPYNHYYNIKKELACNLEKLPKEELIFPYFSYYNYFQRPAYKEGHSIDNIEVDNKIAYETLNEIIKIIQPEKVIFVSIKSFNAYNNNRNKLGENTLDIIKNNFVPHAGMAWWNRKSINYGKNIGTNINRTGRERFIDIITNKI
jgi:hypothetical protein